MQDNNEMVRKAVQESLYKITNPNSETNPLYSNPAIENLSAAAALYGMTLEDMLNPNIDTLRDKLNNPTTNKDNNLNLNDDNPDNIPF